MYLFDEYRDAYLRKLTTFRDACEMAIGDAGIKICIENCGDYASMPHIQNGLDLLLKSPVFALTFDVGHNAAANYTDEPTIMERSDHLRHMHLHDTIGLSNHLVLGEGNVDLAKYLDLAKKHDCRVVLEIKTVNGLRKSVEWINRK